MYATVRHHLDSWLFRLRGPEPGVIVLVQRRVFILPTRQGILFAAVLLVMLTGSINYALGLGFVLTFLLVSLGINAMIYTFRNLVNLRITAGRSQPVFAGDQALFIVNVENDGRADRYAIGIAQGKRAPVYADVPARSIVPVGVRIPAERRGRLRPGKLTLFTRYPLGLYRAWSYVEPDMQTLVYPRPASPALPLPRAAASAGTGAAHGLGQEDFYGLRQYHAGDSPRHIAWKAAARDQGLLTKQFTGRADTELWLDWNYLPAELGVEERLGHLARWVLDAHAAGAPYGLRLTGETVEIGTGEGHRDRCLEALALHEAAPGAAA